MYILLMIILLSIIINNKCCDSSNSFVYLRVQLIGKVYCIYDDCNIEDILWDRVKYW